MSELFTDPRAIRLSDRLTAVPLGAEHFFAIDPQESQRTQYGLDPLDMDWSVAEAIAANPGCYAVLRGEEVLACLGVNPTFPGAAGVTFAFLAKGIGRDHHVLTRFARDVVIGQCTLPRLEAIVRCADIEEVTDTEWPWNDAAVRLAIALGEPTPQVRWAMAVGLRPVAVLRNFGAASETHMLLERIL